MADERMLGKGAAGCRRYYLRSLRMDAFGGFLDREEGPFTSGLNVVWGANESGKTSMAKFIGGVLFGWDDARGSRNAYRPKGASQSGSLVFASLDDPCRTVSCFRARNAEGMVQSDPVEIIGDMDKEAYSAVFSLDSDELRGLGDAEAVMDRLLTAGAGTDSSPARALAQVEAQMKACFSKAASKPDSIPNLKSEISQVRGRIAAAEAESDRLAAYDDEAHGLSAAIPELQQAVAHSNERMESLAGARDALERLDVLERDIVAGDGGLAWDGEAASHSGVQPCAAAGYADNAHHPERADFAEREGHAGHLERAGHADHAGFAGREGRADASARMDASPSPRLGRRSGEASMQLKAALGGFAVLCLLGVALLVLACVRSHLVFAVGAAAVYLAAACLALAAIFLLRAGVSETQGGKSSGQDAWRQAPGADGLASGDSPDVLRRAASSQSASGEAMPRQAGYPQPAPLQFASRQPASSQAAHRQPAPQQAASQRDAAYAQRESVRAQLDRIARERAGICDEWGIGCQDAARQLSLLMRRESQSRDGLQQQLLAANRRSGELRQILAAARGSNDLELFRMQEQMLQGRLHEACREYAKLVLARKALSDALEAWECSSQPKVYEQAGRLMSIMTNGAWRGIRPTAVGMEVTDHAGVPRSARELSLGTCQQLYLALRIALLMVAGNAGANLPVIADDILAHFDDERREAVVLALLELARHRQIILLTCHSSVVELVRNASADVNILRL